MAETHGHPRSGAGDGRRRFLLASTPAAGHLNPALPIARELVARGHEVRWYTGREYREAVEATGARFEPLREAHDPADEAIHDRFPALAELDGLAGFKFALKYLFLDEVPRQVADVRRILAEFPADALVGDTGFLAAGPVHELGGPPFATYNITALTIASRDTAPFGTGKLPATNAAQRLRNRVLSLLTDRVVFRDVTRHQNGMRAGLALPPIPSGVLSTITPYLYLHPSTPAFEYPRRDLPPQVHFVGPLLPAPPAGFTPPAWWPRLDEGRPVVLVNQGTVANDPRHLIAPALAGLAGEDVFVVATTGGPTAAEAGLDVPANAVVEPFVPFAALVPRVDVMVTNGGFGGVQFALSHGVPLVVGGTTEEKPEVNNRVAWAGAGVDLRENDPTPEQVRDGVRRVLAGPGYRRAAQRVQADYARHDAPREAATLLEALADTGRPVLAGADAPHRVDRPEPTLVAR